MSVYFAVTLSFCFAVPLLSCRSVVPLFCLSIVRLFIMLSFHRFFVLSFCWSVFLSFCCSVVLSFCLSIVLSFSLNLSVHLTSSKVVPVSFLTGVLTKFFLSYKLQTTPGPWTLFQSSQSMHNRPILWQSKHKRAVVYWTRQVGEKLTKFWWEEQSVIFREINDHISPPPVIYHK